MLMMKIIVRFLVLLSVAEVVVIVVVTKTNSEELNKIKNRFVQPIFSLLRGQRLIPEKAGEIIIIIIIINLIINVVLILRTFFTSTRYFV